MGQFPPTSPGLDLQHKFDENVGQLGMGTELAVSNYSGLLLAYLYWMTERYSG